MLELLCRRLANPGLRLDRTKCIYTCTFKFTNPDLFPRTISMPVGRCILSSDDVVVRSPTDTRLYRYIHLTNGLCALLVHDPDIYSDEPSGGRKAGMSEGEDEDGEESEEEYSSEEEEDEGEEANDEVKQLKGAVHKKVRFISSWMFYVHN